MRELGADNSRIIPGLGCPENFFRLRSKRTSPAGLKPTEKELYPQRMPLLPSKVIITELNNSVAAARIETRARSAFSFAQARPVFFAWETARRDQALAEEELWIA